VLTPKTWLFSLAVAAVAVGFATSCGQLPTAPPIHLLGTTAAPQRVVQSGSLLGSVDSVVSDPVSLVTKTLEIDGSIGGSLSNGRWNVTVPPGAVSGTATIRIELPNPASPACQLDITPATSNQFAVPVELTVDCRLVPAEKLKTFSIFWYDPSTSTWVPVASSTVDLQNKTVSAPLQHFSKYAVGPLDGRASW
jgi:hypothetical protein